MRLALCLVMLSALPAAAWQAGTEGRLCTLRHAGAEADVWMTFDPAGPLYAITLTRPASWPGAPSFSIRFDGGWPLTISTSRHVLSEAGRALTVTDGGFGNVLDGLALNDTATAYSGGAAVTLDLDGAAPEVEAFRACTTAPAV